MARSGGAERSQAGDTALLGRQQELGDLALALAEALAGRGQFCVLAGESGIGKTRLADEIAARAASEGATVRWGRAWEGGGAPAFWPWVQVIRGLSEGGDSELLRRQLGAGAKWVAQIVPELRALLPDIEPPGSLDTDQARFALFDAVATFLCRVAGDRPLAILLDDVHAADPPTLLMLEFVARSVRDAPIFLLASYQEAAAAGRPEIDTIVNELAREARQIVLRRLNEADIARLIAMRGNVDPSPELARALHATTDGNPFFATEVVRLLAAEGQLERQRGGATARFPLPDTVRDAVRRRFEPLGAAAGETLQMAAVIGREFRLGTLERATGVAREQLIETLDRAVTVDLIGELEGTPGLFRFDHGLMRETLYGELSPTRRIRAHGVVGDTLEEQYANEPEPHVAELAHHFLAAAPAGYAEKAADYAARAGERAMRLLAYEEAARLFEGALGSLELAGPDPPRRAELLLALGRAQVRAGDPAATATLVAAAAAARTLRRPELLAQAALGFRAFARVPGVVDEEVVGLLEEALERLDTEDSTLRARVLVRVAVQIYDRLGAADRRQELVDEAIAMARRLGDPATLGYVLHNAQLATWGPDTREQALEWSKEVLPLAEQDGDVELVLVTHSRQADLLLELDDLPGADLEIEALDRRVRDSGEPRARAHVALQRSRRAAMDGRFDDAERLSVEAAELGARAGDSTIPVITMGQDWGLRWSQGRLGEIEPETRQFADALPGMPVWRAALAAVYCDLGREAEARRELERLAARDFAGVPRNAVWLLAAAILAEVCADLGDRERATTLYGLLEPFARRNVVSFFGLYLGPVARYLGLLAATREDWSAAADHFTDAVLSAERAGARPVLAILRIDEARMLAARDEPGDRERALELLAEAAERARELGTPGLEQRAAALVAELGGQGPPAPGPAASPAAPTSASLRREGDVWLFDYDGRGVRVRDSKGLRYLAMLLANPGVEVHAMELMGAGEPDAAARGAAAPGVELTAAGDDSAGPLLDAKAKAAYRSRLEELREEAEEAESFNDPERAARAREEIEFLGRELAGAVGLGGRDRKAASNAERARVNVTRSIRGVVKRVAEYDAELGRELETSVRTGTFCAYEPDPRRPVSWSIDAG
ncbi:MAG: hypothetical protein QOK25_2162 [Thermoleophilaceae bacterium]|nr:hypothetical protein [Thermoleophilaceae bacterium]